MDLYDDILLLIMSYLKYHDWMNFRMTCRRINNLVTDYDKWKRMGEFLRHVVELHKKGNNTGNPKICHKCNSHGYDLMPMICKYCQRTFCIDCHFILICDLKCNNIYCDKCRKIVCPDCHKYLGVPISKAIDFFSHKNEKTISRCQDCLGDVITIDEPFYCHKCRLEVIYDEDDFFYNCVIVDNKIVCLNCLKK